MPLHCSFLAKFPWAVMVLAMTISGCGSAPANQGAVVEATVDPAFVWGNPSGGLVPGALEHASNVIAQCLERASSVPNINKTSCVHSVVDICIEQLGTSQRDMTSCAQISRMAWETRLAAVRTRLNGARTIELRYGDAKQAVRAFQASERRWEAWNQADCEFQASGSEGGSIHPMEIALCLSGHAANRALELESLAWWWDKSFRLDSAKQ